MSLDELVRTPLSDVDMNRLSPSPKLRLVKYSDLDKYKSIDKLLSRKIDGIILFIEVNRKNTGHYVGLFRIGNLILYFDPYGFRPDKALSWTPKQTRINLGIDFPHLSWLLNKAVDDKYVIEFSTDEYQERKDPSIQTCGRHVLFFYKWLISTLTAKKKPSLKGLFNQYYKYITKLRQKYEMTYDELVSYFIN